MKDTALRDTMDLIGEYCEGQCPEQDSKTNASAFKTGMLEAWVAMLLLGLMTLDEIRERLNLPKGGKS